MKQDIRPPRSLNRSARCEFVDDLASEPVTGMYSSQRHWSVGVQEEDEDDDLEQRVLRFLASSNLPGLRHLQVHLDGDTVVLRGRVQTFYEKQLAGEFSRRVPGVFHVVDLVEVCGYVPRADDARDDHWRRSSSPQAANTSR